MLQCTTAENADRFELPSPLGVIQVQIQSEQLQHITLDANAGEAATQPSSCFGRAVARWLRDYLGDAAAVSCIHNPVGAGTVFQQRVWRALCEIPMGETRTYGELAKALGSAPRAVGQACRRNPTPILVPCHRVISVSGLGGYDGVGEGAEDDIKLQHKRWLLRHEGVRL
jgi:methylated-DNA-[protein]-cysteine S-methyltransferase